MFYAGALTKLFEHIATIVDGHESVVERHYGVGKMVKVIERLQMEADVQGGIILDSWSDERSVDRRLTDVKSYPFSFLVQSFLSQQRGFGGTPRVNSPAIGGGTNDARNSEDEGVDMKEVDALLGEIAVMLEKWSAYARFLALRCRVSRYLLGSHLRWLTLHRNRIPQKALHSAYPSSSQSPTSVERSMGSSWHHTRR